MQIIKLLPFSHHIIHYVSTSVLTINPELIMRCTDKDSMKLFALLGVASKPLNETSKSETNGYK